MNALLGIGLKLVATLAFAGMVACIKAMPAVPTGEVVFARSLFALLPIALYFGLRGRLLSAFRVKSPMGHLKRTLAGGISMLAWFAALKLLPLPEALAISYVTPIITLVLAVIMLGETMRLFRWSAAVSGFAGVLVILWPRLGAISAGFAWDDATLGAGLALLSAFFVALAMIQIRQLVATESSQTVVMIFTLSTTCIGLATLPFGWTVPDATEVALLVGSGLFGGIGQIFLTECYRHADASTVAPFEYASMIWGLAIAYVLFAEVPSTAVISGSLIVIAAGLVIIYREHRLGLRRGVARPLQPQQN